MPITQQEQLLQDVESHLQFLAPVDFGAGQEMPSVGAVMTSTTGAIERLTEDVLQRTGARDRVSEEDWAKTVQDIIGAVSRCRNRVCGIERVAKVDMGWFQRITKSANGAGDRR